MVHFHKEAIRGGPSQMAEKIDVHATTNADTGTAGAADKFRARAKNSLRGTTDLIRGLAPVTKAGVLGAMGPGAMGKAAGSIYRWDFLPSGLLGIAAARDPHHTAIIDDGGSMTYAEFDDNANRLARALR